MIFDVYDPTNFDEPIVWRFRNSNTREDCYANMAIDVGTDISWISPDFTFDLSSGLAKSLFKNSGVNSMIE